MKKIKKVFVGMSGGVDSSVSAYLLKKKGYDVTGIFIHSYNLDGCSEKDSEDARRAAEEIGIPFYVWDFQEEYKRQVVDYMVSGYEKGLTPNPDVMCNKEIKFGSFFRRAMELGADYVATGHYAVIKHSRGYHRLFKGRDKEKDQSYFLWTLGQNELSRTIFPVGNFSKSKVRRIAKAARLHNADKKDSQGICFLGKISIKDFLKKRIPPKQGDILNENGEKIGEHDGAWYYTIGQRHGFGLASGKPLYISEKNIEKNTITVSGVESKNLEASEITVSDINRITDETKKPFQAYMRVRYRQPLQAVFVTPLRNDHFVARCSHPIKFAAIGQSAVFYSRKGEVIAGGNIESFS